MASEECTIQVHVRRTGEIVSIKVIPFLTTYGDIIKIICEKITELEPSHYYIALNYEIQMEDYMLFERKHEHQSFQMIMKTKWLLEYIAEQTMYKQRLKPEMRHVLDTYTPIVEVPAVILDENPENPTSMDISIPTDHVISPSEMSTEQNEGILVNIVRSTIKKIPRQDVQEYLHASLEKAFDILLMGSPRVGKSTLINAILKKDLAKTSAGRNACTSVITSYEYEENYISSIDDKSLTTSTCSIRIWDAPGIEDWTKLDVSKYIKNLFKEKNPICLIYCASPGSYADIEHIKIIIEQCQKFQIFVALVVTNMYASDEVDDILETFKILLAQHCLQTKAVGDVFYYGTIGLCTLVNSIEYETQGVKMKTTGVDELMLGIMNSLSEEKLLQWCFALMDNGPFWIRTQVLETLSMGNKIVLKSRTSKELSSQNIALLKASLKLSEDEILDLHCSFWNDFPSGKMDKKGFIKYYEEIKDEKDKTNVLCDHVFAVFDKDHDGTIDFHEFLLAIAAGSPGDLDSHLKYVFEMCDVSGDGHMDLQELTTFLKASLTIAGKSDKVGNNYPKELAIGVFKTLGISEGKKLNREEFIRGCKNDPGLRELFGGGH